MPDLTLRDRATNGHKLLAWMCSDYRNKDQQGIFDTTRDNAVYRQLINDWASDFHRQLAPPDAVRFQNAIHHQSVMYGNNEDYVFGGLRNRLDCLVRAADEIAALHAVGIETISPKATKVPPQAELLTAGEHPRADVRADGSKKKQKILPENDDVKRLALELSRELPKGEKSRTQIAEEFTPTSNIKPSSLLRKIRDYPALREMVDKADPKKK